MNKVTTIVVLLLLVSCSNYGQLTFVSKLPKKLNENSGIISLEKNKIWVIEDGGNTDELFEVNFEGDLLKEFKVTNAKNKDWEDLTKDEEGNVYIGDIGNNYNDRKDLVIYKVPNPTKEPGQKIPAKAIRFSYPEQKEFPPKVQHYKYNAEALFYNNDSLYLITKNQSRPFKGDALVYRIPAIPGEYKAELIGSIITCEDPSVCIVTAATISPNGKTVAVLGYGKLWIYTDFLGSDFTRGKMETIDLGATTQLESICFLDDVTLLLSDEQSHGRGRNLYTFKLP